MQAIKMTLSGILILVLIGAGLLVARHHVPQLAFLNRIPNFPQTPKIDLPTLPQPVTNLFSQAQSSVPKTLSSLPVGKVLGTNSNSSSEKTSVPLYKRAFESARYTYCEQVVKDYQERYETQPSSDLLENKEASPSAQP
jgi:hypothetical protein